VFKDNIITISDEVENMLKTTYLNIEYLGDSYLTKFMQNLNGDITALYNQTNAKTMFLGTLNYVKSFYFIYLGI
jgi:hypothetical protein